MASARVGVVGRSRALAALRRKLAADGAVELVGLDPGDRVDAVLLELTDEPDAVEAIAPVRETAAAPVIALARTASPALLDGALAAGAADVFVQPYDPGSVLFAVEKALHASRPAPGSTRVLTVFSPKGGTGKSAIATNLGVLLARRSASAILLDLDLEFGDASLMLGLTPQSSVHELLATPTALDEHAIAVHADRHPSGLHLLAAPPRPEDAELADETALQAVLRAAVARYGTVVVDTAPSFDAATLAALDVTDELLVVCTPDIATVKNVRLALQTLARLDLPRLASRVVLNRAGEPAALTRGEVESALERPVDVVLPFDPAVQRGVNLGRPAALDRSPGPFADALRLLADEREGAAPEHHKQPLRRLAAAFSR